jgi:hypothetical protein
MENKNVYLQIRASHASGSHISTGVFFEKDEKCRSLYAIYDVI